MKDFADASFSPETIKAMTSALQAAIDTLPEPVSSHLIHRLAETILRVARDGESNELVLQRMALLELQIGPGAKICSEENEIILALGEARAFKCAR